MAKIIKFPFDNSNARTLRKAKRKHSKSEDHGQLNIFDQEKKEGKVVGFNPAEGNFESALSFLDSDPELAFQYLERSIEKEEHKSDAFCNLGILTYDKGDIVKAIDFFTRSLELDPRHFESHFNLANIYFEIGNYKLASVHYKFASQIEPEDASTRYNLGLVLANLEEYEDAITQLELFLNMGNTNDQETLKLIGTLRGIRGAKGS